jgi:hypothetical protein
MAMHRTVDEIRSLLKGVAADRAKGLTVGQARRKQGISEAARLSRLGGVVWCLIEN